MGGVSITFKTVEQTSAAARKEENSPQPKANMDHQYPAEEGKSKQNNPNEAAHVDMEVEEEAATNLSPNDEEEDEFTEADGDLDDLYENDDLIGEELEAIMEEDMQDGNNDEVQVVIGETPKQPGAKLDIPITPPIASMNNLAIVTNTISNSGSLKRKGEEDGDEDTASSKPKRSRTKQVP